MPLVVTAEQRTAAIAAAAEYLQALREGAQVAAPGDAVAANAALAAVEVAALAELDNLTRAVAVAVLRQISQTLNGDATGALTSALVVALRGRPLADQVPNAGELLHWHNNTWMPGSKFTSPDHVRFRGALQLGGARWYPCGWGNNTSTNVLTAGALIAVPFIGTGGTIAALAVEVTTASAGNYARVGFCNADQSTLYPSSLICETSAPASADSTGVKELTLPAPITTEPGKLYYGLFLPSGGATWRTFTAQPMTWLTGYSSASFSGNSVATISKTSYPFVTPLPSTFPAGAAGDIRTPIICVRFE